MSRINGEKARSAIARKRNTAQRLKARTLKAAATAAAKPAKAAAPATKK